MLNKESLCIHLFLVFSISCFSQNNQKIDSLLKIIEVHTIEDSCKIKALNSLFFEYRYTNDSLATLYLNKAITFSAKKKYTLGYALSLYNKGVFEGEHGNFDSSDIYLNQSFIQYKKINDLNGLSSCKMAFGFNQYDKANYTQALIYFFASLKLKEISSDLKGQSAANIWIGNVYNNGLSKPKMALPFYEKALSLQEILNDESSMAFTYNNIGNVHYFLKDYSKALNNYLKSSEIKEKIGNKKGLGSTYDNIANVYFDLSDFKLACFYYQKALKIREEFGDKKGINTSYLNIANLLFKQNKYQESITILLKALELSEKIDNKEVIKEASNSLSACYEALGDFKNAFYYNKLSYKINDSIINSKYTEQIIDIQTKYDVEKKDLELAKNKAEIETEKNKRFITYGALVFFMVLFSIAIWAFYQKKKSAKLLSRKNTLLQNANELITHQKEEISEKQKEILDSINYAQKIQKALLASEEMLFENSLNHFLLFKPKDIVSGDFTWATKINNYLFLACCDSTGHGIPGAFMSLLNIGFLSEAVKERAIFEPGEIFNYVRDRLIETIGKDEQQDGFDGILLRIDLNSKSIAYSAANNSPLLIRNEIIINLSCNKMPVGKGIKTESFSTFTLDYQKNDTLYLYTDGYPDQFGGPKGKKFKYKPFENLLLQNASNDLLTQKETINTEFENWRGELEQVDDVCVVGIKL